MTAVEWLIEQMQTNQFIYLDRTEILNKAKEMEKNQIKKSFSDGSQWELYGSDLTYEERAKQYYNTTFKSE